MVQISIGVITGITIILIKSHSPGVFSNFHQKPAEVTKGVTLESKSRGEEGEAGGGGGRGGGREAGHVYKKGGGCATHGEIRVYINGHEL